MSNLAKIMKIVPSFCYLCTERNPQFLGRLADSRKVWYCGDCWNNLQDGLNTWRNEK